MKISYDEEADAMYILLRKKKVHQTREVDENTMIDYDKEGNIIGIELLFVKERMHALPKRIQEENLAVI